MNGGNDENGIVTSKFEMRLKGTLQAYRRHPGAKLLVQGGFGHFNATLYSTAYYASQYLLSQGVPKSDMVVIYATSSTVEEALSVQRFLLNYPVKSIFVVTSHFHLKRTRVVFEHFFDPEQLQFVGTPDGVIPTELARWRQHKKKGLKLLREQGGVILEGQLFRRRHRKDKKEAT